MLLLFAAVFVVVAADAVGGATTPHEGCGVHTIFHIFSSQIRTRIFSMILLVSNIWHFISYELYTFCLSPFSYRISRATTISC